MDILAVYQPSISSFVLKLHDFLLSKVSPDKIHLNKKVLSVIQNKEGA